MPAALIALALLAAPPVVPTGVFGVELGAAPKAAQAAFAPHGQVQKATWQAEQAGPDRLHLRFDCDPARQCYAVPSGAELYFLGGHLAAATLRVDAAAAPPDLPVMAALLKMEGASGLGAPAVTTRAVGREVRYYLKDAFTVVWVQDGRDAEIKLYLDARAPLGRAEAVAAGAPAAGLERLPGATAYADAHRAIGARDWSTAIDRLEAARAAPQVSPLLAEQATLVLAMTLAARVKDQARPDAAWKEDARRDLARARALAPSLAEHLDELSRGLGL